MTKFSFSLERVMEWRRTQLRIEEARLQRLRADVVAAETNVSQLQSEQDASLQAVLQGQTTTGQELASLDAYRRAAVRRRGQLQRVVADCQARVTQQMAVVGSRERDLKLLERLKAQKRRTWSEAADLEMEQQAAELHLARLSAQARPQAR